MAREMGMALTIEGLSAYEQATNSVVSHNREVAASIGETVAASGQMDKATKGVVSALDAATPGLLILGGAMTGVGAKALSFGKNLALTAARADEMRLVMEMVGKNVGITADQLAAEEKKIQSLGITVETSRTLLTRFMQANLDVAKASDIARAAQDMAVAVGEDSSATAQRLTVAIVTQNLELLRGMGIMETREQLLQRLAAAQGKSVEQLTAAEKQQAVYNLVMDKAATFAGAYEASMENAGKRLRSLSRHVNTAAIAIGQYLMPTLARGVDIATTFVKAIYNAPEPIKKLIANAIKATAVIGTFGGALLLKAAILPKIAANLGLVGLSLKSLIGPLMSSLGPWGLLMGAITLVVKVIRDQWGTIGPYIMAAINAMKTGFAEIVAAMQPLFVIWQNWGQVIAKEVGQIVSLIVQGLLPVFQTFAQFVHDTMSNLAPVLQKAAGYFTYFFRVVSMVLSAIVELLRGNTRSAGLMFQRAWQTAVAVVYTVLQKAVSNIVSYGQALIANFSKGIIQGIMKFLAPAIAAVGKFIRGLMAPGSPPKFLPDIGTWGTEAMNEYVAGFGAADFDMLYDYTSRFRDVLGEMAEEGALAPEAMADTFFELRGTLAGLMSDFEETGEISEASLDVIRQRLGDVGAAYADIIKAQLEYQKTQKDLAAIEEGYKAIEAAERELDVALQPYIDALEEAKILEEALSGEARAAFEAGEIGVEEYEDRVLAARKEREEKERTLKLAEASQIDARQGLKDQRSALDVAKAEAEERVKAAEEQVKLAEALLRLHEETRDVLAEQTKLIEEATEKGGAGKGEEGAAAPEIEAPGAADIGDIAAGVAEDFGDSLTGNMADVLDFGKLLPDVEANRVKVGGWFGNIFAGIGDKIQPFLQKAITFLTPIFDGLGKTWDNLVATAQQVWGILTQVWGTVVKVAQTVWPKVQRIINVVMNAIGKIVTYVTTRIWPAFSSVMLAVTTWINDNWPRVEAIIVKVFDAVSSAIAWFVELVMPTVIEVFDKVSAWVDENWPLIADTITTVLDTIVTVVETVVTAIETFWKNNGEAIMAGVENAWNFISSIITTVVDVILSVVKTLLQVITGDFEGAKETLIGIWEGIKNFAVDTWQSLSDAVSGVVDGLVTLVKLNVQGWSDWLTGVWTSISDTAKTWWDNVTLIISTVVAAIYLVVTTTIESVQTWLSDTWSSISGTVTTWWDTISTTISDTVDKVYTTVTDVITNVKTWLSDTWTSISDTVTTWWDTIKTTISDAIDNAYTAVTDTVETIKTSITEKWDEIKTWLESFSLYDIAAGIVQGIIDGIKAKATEVVDSLKGLVGDAVGAAKNLLGIGSPSKVFEGIAGDIGAGILKGVADIEPKVKVALGDLVAPDRQVSAPAAATQYNRSTSVSYGDRSVVIQQVVLSNGMTTQQFQNMLRETLKT